MTEGFIVASKPSGIGIQHLFRRPGQWSLCEEAVWLEVQRDKLVTPLTWVCVRCKALATGEPDPASPQWRTT